MRWRPVTHRIRTAVEDRTQWRVPRVASKEEIARLAYSYWEARGRPHGSAAEDWLRAERDLWAAIAVAAAPSTEVNRPAPETAPRNKEYSPQAS
jgi:Protein of unknown function (DUF2934)